MESGSANRLLESYRRMTVLLLLFVIFLGGVAQADPIVLVRTKLLARGVVAVGLAFWCGADATLRGRYDVWPAQWQVMVSWPATVPAYLITTRRWRAVPVLCACGLVTVAIGFAGLIVGEYLLGE